MDLKEKIQFLLGNGYTQQEIESKTGIEQSSVSRISNGTQKSVHYEKGKKLDALIERLSPRTASQK